MGWIRRTEPKPEHPCEPPAQPLNDDPRMAWFTTAAGAYGDLWRCDECGVLWRRLWSSWHRAGWWHRWRYHRQGWAQRA